MDPVGDIILFNGVSIKLCAAIVAVFLSFIYVKSEETAYQKFWRTHPLPGPKRGWFRWFRATFRSISKTKEIVDEGYYEYSRKGATFTIPSFDMGGFVVVPPTQLKRLYGLPDTKLDTLSSQLTVIQAQYTIEDLDILHQPFHTKILGAQLPKALGELTTGMAKQVALGLEKNWGVSEEWKEVTLNSSVANVISRSMNFVYVGEELCQKPTFMEPMQFHGAFIFGSGFIINTLPGWLRPVAGKGVAIYGRKARAKCMRDLHPLVEKRMKQYNEYRSNPSGGVEFPKDAIQWAIEDSFKMEDSKNRDAYQIAHRILLLNFASIHTTGLVAANTILDIFCTDPAAGIVEDLREEAADALAATGGQWTKETLLKLPLLDATIRESMRVSPTSILGLPRRLTDPGGADMTGGTNIPQGISIVTPVEAIHLDPGIHTKPHEYHPFRSCEPSQLEGKRCQVTEQTLRAQQSTTDAGEMEEIKPDYKFTGFGFGRHACPGRFFAMHVLKIAVAQMLLQYEVEFIIEKPPKFRALWIQTPLETTSIRLRRRKDL